MADHGVFVTEQDTSVGSPVVAETGIPFVIGTAPIQAAKNPARVGVPVKINGWNEFVDKFGYTPDWENYTLCEFAFSHFVLYGMQPAIFVNVLDPATKKAPVEAADLDVINNKVMLPIDAIDDEFLVVKPETGTGTAYEKNTDYVTYYNEAGLAIEILPNGGAASATKLNIAYTEARPSEVQASDIATGMEAIELCTTMLGIVPDLIVAPKYSENATVAAVMAAKAGGINGMFGARALIDIPSGDDGAKEYTEVAQYKNSKSLTDERQALCWPKVRYDGKIYHYSTHLAGVIAANDNNFGAPHVSPSNKTIIADGLVTADGEEVNLTLDQANALNNQGVITAINFMGGWKAWGNYTACYPSVTDIKDNILCIGRMFDWVRNTTIQTCWSYVDAPMTRLVVDNIVDTLNIWMNGLTGSGYLLGGRVEMIAEENPPANLAQGIVKFHVYLTPPSPAQEINFTLEYDMSYLEAAFQ